MRILRTAGFAGLALLATAGQAAQTVQTVQQKCLTAEEASALFASVAPGLIRSLIATCSPALPADAYLRVRGGALIERYVGPAATSRSAAMAAFGKISDAEIPESMFDTMADSMIGDLAVQKIKPKDCAKIDRIVALLDPLPAANIMRLVATIVEFAVEDDKSPSPVTICKPGEG